jgi:hypothetical protein
MKKPIKRDELPDNFSSIDEFQDFWDKHSSADYDDLMVDVVADVDLIGSKVYCPVAKEVLSKIKIQAHSQGISIETLINLWLLEKTKEPCYEKSS